MKSKRDMRCKGISNLLAVAILTTGISLFTIDTAAVAHNVTLSNVGPNICIHDNIIGFPQSSKSLRFPHCNR